MEVSLEWTVYDLVEQLYVKHGVDRVKNQIIVQRLDRYSFQILDIFKDEISVKDLISQK